MRGDAELASVMRKLLASPDGFVSINRHIPGRIEFTFDDCSVPVTEEEQQMIEEVTGF